MMAKSIMDSDLFLEMPQSSQNLYFHLLLRADDDGFVGNPRQIMRMVNCSEDDMRILIMKQFLIPFNSGIVVIKHWKIHNYIRNDRYKPTIYQEEKKLLEENDNKEYKLGIPDGYQRETQYSIGKYSIVKDSIEKNNNNAQRRKELEEEFEQLWAMYPNKKGKTNALKAYLKARDKYSFEEIEQGIRNYIFYIKESGLDPQFIKHGSTWFNQQCWNDDYTVYKQESKFKHSEPNYTEISNSIQISEEDLKKYL